MRNLHRINKKGSAIRENISYILFCCFGVFSSKAQETGGVYAEYDGGAPKYYAD